MLLKACSSVVELCHYMAVVGGSIPSAPSSFCVLLVEVGS